MNEIVNAVIAPVVIGVPLNTHVVPLLVSVIHDGSVPDETVQVTEVTGPTVLSVTV